MLLTPTIYSAGMIVVGRFMIVIGIPILLAVLIMGVVTLILASQQTNHVVHVGEEVYWLMSLLYIHTEATTLC